MKILYYIPLLNQANGGVRQYSYSILNTLSQDIENEYYILHQSNDPLILELLYQHQNFNLIHPKIGKERIWEKINTSIRKALNLIKFIAYDKHVKINSYIDRIVKKYAIDIVHSPTQFAPYVQRAKVISTMHDIQSLHFPEYFSPKERMTRAIFYYDYLRRSDSIIVSFQHVKEDLIKYFQLSPDKIKVILMEMSSLWFEKYASQSFKKPNFIGFEKYLLYPANTWKHKNHIRLLEAIHDLKIKKNLKVYLVCTGNKNEHYKDIKNKIDELNLGEQVLFSGILNEDDLYATYKHAHGVIIPTIYEAGSFPLIESLIMNIPVICSNVTSLPETIKNDKFTFNPFSVPDMSYKINQLWSDDFFLKENLINAKVASTQLLNANTLQKIKNVYQELNHI